MREYEAKYSCDNIDENTIRDALSTFAIFSGIESQVDTVFAYKRDDILHPRVGTVVARLRSAKSDPRVTLTVKRRRAADLDRDEFETTVGSAEAARQILGLLGLVHVLTVKKHRTVYRSGVKRALTINLDNVVGLGTFMEFELLLSEDADDKEASIEMTRELERVRMLLDTKLPIVTKGYDRLLGEANRWAD